MAKKEADEGNKNERDLIHIIKTSWKKDPRVEKLFKHSAIPFTTRVIDRVDACRPSTGRKSDVVLQIYTKKSPYNIRPYEEHYQLKQCGQTSANHVYRSSVAKCAVAWGMSEEEQRCFSLFTGTILPYKDTKKPHRMKANEMSPEEAETMVTFFRNNLRKIMEHAWLGDEGPQPKYIVIHLTPYHRFITLPMRTWIDTICDFVHDDIEVGKQFGTVRSKTGVWIQRKGSQKRDKHPDDIQVKCNLYTVLDRLNKNWLEEGDGCYSSDLEEPIDKKYLTGNLYMGNYKGADLGPQIHLFT